jgi:hypothetical protein
MKSIIALAAIAILALGNVIATTPNAAASMRTLSAAQLLISDHELLFDR